MKPNRQTPDRNAPADRKFIQKFLVDYFPHTLGTDVVHLNHPASIPVLLDKLKTRNARLKRPA